MALSLGVTKNKIVRSFVFEFLLMGIKNKKVNGGLPRPFSGSGLLTAYYSDRPHKEGPVRIELKGRVNTSFKVLASESAYGRRLFVLRPPVL